MIMAAIPLAAALDCETTAIPSVGLIDTQVEWLCRTNQTSCISYVKFEDRLLQANPEPKPVEDVGMVDQFSVNGGIVRVYFTKKNLRDGYNFTYGVKCGSETFETNATAAYLPAYQIQDRLLWFKGNIPLFVGAFFALLVIAFILVIIRKFLNGV